MRILLETIGVVGVFIYAISFGFTFGIPVGVESIASEFIKYRLEKETTLEVDSLLKPISSSIFGKTAQRILHEKENEIERIRAELNSFVIKKSDDIVNKMVDFDRNQRLKKNSDRRKYLQKELLSLEKMKEYLIGFMSYKYTEITNKLTTELRIFTSLNLVLFLLLLISSFLKPNNLKQLLTPGFLLTVTIIVCSYFYLFEQNWFFTIFYGNYLGFWYLAYVVVLFLWFCDILIYKAKITTLILSGILSLLLQHPIKLGSKK
ncbi:MAG: hypothetical protein OEZ47_17595 [Gammaproteobacteria bacterium]|nr:hypothetical protein [Gammaproteobacteria bacterium]